MHQYWSFKVCSEALAELVRCSHAPPEVLDTSVEPQNCVTGHKSLEGDCDHRLQRCISYCVARVLERVV
jgi:hypothetical protein